MRFQNRLFCVSLNQAACPCKQRFTLSGKAAVCVPHPRGEDFPLLPIQQGQQRALCAHKRPGAAIVRRAQGEKFQFEYQ